MNAERLSRELRDLGRFINTPPIDTEALTERTMAQLTGPAHDAVVAPHRSTVPRRRWRALAGALAGILILLALTPAVRAAVGDWFGVIVRSGLPAESEPIPEADSALTFDAARELVSFEPVEPPMLGTPDGVEVSPDGRVLSMTWSDADRGVIRLDQFAGVEPAYVKESHLSAELIELDGTMALWFDGPHHVVRLDEDGREVVESARSAGPTLILPLNEITVRIEGMDRTAAIDVARSLTGTE